MSVKKQWENQLEEHPTYAVIIGINQYENADCLKTAVPDAKEITEILENQYGYRVSLNEDCTLQELKDLLEKLKNNKIYDTTNKTLIDIPEKGRLLFYFAGHGIDTKSQAEHPEGFLVPKDGKPKYDEQNKLVRKSLEDTCLSMQDLFKTLEDVHCRHWLVILDCCLAASLRYTSSCRKFKLKQQNKIISERLFHYLNGQVQLILTSTAHDQNAADSIFTFRKRDENQAIDNHSPFAHVLIEGLKINFSDKKIPADSDADGIVTLSELFSYLEEEFKKLNINKTQTPGLYTKLKQLEAVNLQKLDYVFIPKNFQLNQLNTAEKELGSDYHKNPYKGLFSYEKEDKNIFCGRDDLREELLKKVSQEKLVPILGASGSGKSSLVKAGLIPKLKEQHKDWKFIIMRPLESPFKSLHDELNTLEISSNVKPQENKFSHLFDKLLFRLNIKRNNTLDTSYQDFSQEEKAKVFEELQKLINAHCKTLIFIDQFEELITICKNKERKEFLYKLNEIIKNNSKLHVVLTLRSGSEPQFNDNESELKECWREESEFSIKTMSREELQEAIEKPANLHIMDFDNYKLIDDMINEVIGREGALPLLSFVLYKLYQKYLDSGRKDRYLSKEDYDNLGGVKRAVTNEATRIYQSLRDEQKIEEEIIRNIMLRMVSTEANQQSRRRVRIEELEYSKPIQNKVNKVIEKFVEARLLVQGKDYENKIYVEPVHEELVRGWNKLQEWIRNEKHLNLLPSLTLAAIEWKNKKTSLHLLLGSPYLWHGNVNLDALKREVLNNKSHNWLNKLETEFVRSSIGRKNVNIRSRWIFVSMVIAGLGFLWGQSELGKIRGSIQSAKGSLESSRDLEGMRQILRARKITQNPIVNFMLPDIDATDFKTTLQKVYYRIRERNRLQLDRGRVYNFALSPNDNFVASVGDGDNVRLWDMLGKQLSQFSTRQQQVYSIAFNKNMHLLATGGFDGTVKFWEVKCQINWGVIKYGCNNISSIEPITQIPKAEQKNTNAKKDIIYTLAFSRNSEQMATFRWDDTNKQGTINLWKVTKNKDNKIRIEEDKTFSQKTDKIVYSMAFHKDGNILATTTAEDRVCIWNLKQSNNTSNNDCREFPTEQRNIYSLASRPSDGKLATGGADGKVKLWEINSNGTIDYNKTEEIPIEQKNVYKIAFSSGNQLATLGEDEIIRLRNSSGLESYKVYPKEERTEETLINSVAFSPSGKYLATVVGKNVVKLWDTSGTPLLRFRTLNNNAKTKSVIFSADGQKLAAIAENGTIEWRNIEGKQINKPITGDLTKIKSLAFSNDGKFVASVEGNGIVKLGETNNTLNPLQQTDKKQTQTDEYESVAFSPDSKILATSSRKNGSVSFWDISGKPSGRPFQAGQNIVYSLAYSPDGRYLATSEANAQGLVKIWDISPGKPISLVHQLPTYQKTIKSIAFNPFDRNQLVTGGEDGTVRMWELWGNNQTRIQTQQANIENIAFTPNGKHIVTFVKGEEKGWEIEQNGIVRQIKITGILHSQLEEWQKQQVTNIKEAFSAGGDLRAILKKVNNNIVVELQEKKDGQFISQKELETQQSEISDLGFIKQTNQLITVGKDGMIKLWDTNGNQIHQFSTPQNNISKVAFSPDGKQFITIGNGGEKNQRKTIRMWNIVGNNHDEFIFPQFPLSFQKNISTASFSPDGKLLAIAEENGTLSLWQTDGVNEIITSICNETGSYLQQNPDINEEDRQLCQNTSISDISTNISLGERILVRKATEANGIYNVNTDKLNGVQAFADGDFATAQYHFEKYLGIKRNDPEARIYLNNAKIGNAKSYTIAVSAPIGGDAESDVDGALEILRGVAQSQEEINLAGGINGTKLRVLIADDGNNPKLAKKIASKLSDNNDVLGVVGHYASDVTLEAGKVYQDRKIAAISPVSTSTELSNFGKLFGIFGNQYVFRTVPNDTEAATKLAKYISRQTNQQAQETSAKALKQEPTIVKPVIFYNSQSHYSKSLKQEFIKANSQEGTKLEQQLIDLSKPNFNAHNSLKNLTPNSLVVLLPDTETLNKALDVAKRVKELRGSDSRYCRVQILAGDDVYTPSTLTQGKENTVGMLVAVPWHIGADPKSAFSVNSYNLWQAPVSWRTAMSYDATQALISAITLAEINGETSREKVAEQLRSEKFMAKGATSEVRFSGSGDRRNPRVQLVEIKQSPDGRRYEFVPSNKQDNDNNFCSKSVQRH